MFEGLDITAKEHLYNNLNKKITEIKIKQRELQGWRRIHQFIETAPYCHHKEQIIIMRFCPNCLRLLDNVCKICITEEEMEIDS